MKAVYLTSGTTAHQVAPSTLWLSAAMDAAPAASTKAADAATGETEQDRATTFKADKGGGDMQSGEMLLIEAYALIWIFAMFFIYRTMSKQSKLDAKVDDLRRVVETQAKD